MYPLRLQQALGGTAKYDQLVYPMAVLMAVSGLSLSVFSLRQLGIMHSVKSSQRK